jgi:prolyl-tRNA editing enzyme YbaK/EbsC (Cys-tRNA(Pro) deacylase)
MSAHVDVHAKIIRGSCGAPLVHSLEHQLELLSQRFDAIDKALNAAVMARKESAARNAVPAAAPKAAAENSEWKPCSKDTPEVARLRSLTKDLQLTTSKFAWVPSEYYDKPLAWRKQQLGAPSTQHLCKAIVLENTHCVNDDCSDARNSRYYVAVFQYVQRFDADKVMRFIKGMNESVGKKKFNFRLAADGEAVTGFSHNAVVPFGLKTPMPIILSKEITNLAPAHFWLGGGHVDCKLRLDTEEFLEKFEPFVADITVPYSDEELASM